jgi:thermolysin metallopeptidase-like protein
VRIFPNDPEATVGLVPATPLPREPGDPPFVIEGRRYAPAPYDPGTLAFQYWQGEVALQRTIRVWEDLFDRDFAAWQGGRPLRVRLRAGKDLNAFYDRKSLQFFYDVDKTTGRTVYAAESLDVVAHECGHAVLDVYQPGYWSSLDLETASFHEAFADCSALLTTLTDSSVRKAFLEESGAGPRKSNLVSRLAEALGRAIFDNFGPGANSDPTRLRDANNSFRYAPPDSLPPGASDAELAAEPHSFSRVFTGAFYDTLVWLLARELKRDATELGVERARRLAGRILGRAVETIAPGEARFRAVGLRMREIDQTEEGGVATIGIEEAFARHGMPLPRLAAGRTKAGAGYRALRALDPDRPGGAAAIRAALGVPRGARLERTTLPARVGRGVREQFIHRDSIAVRHPSLGRLSGVSVRVLCGCTFTRDPAGNVEGGTLAPHPHPTSAEVARQLRRWIAIDAIESSGRGPRTSRELFRARKPFRVSPSRMIERVYFD